ncbi:hypothetical protein AM571_CH01445 [Rhizobium etli 8C-3]|uniref:Uncharacterized protein n=1 Tax=Rhizobium etli 8C-3 TaxID=538025 RepID=A0A1L5P2A2_RHIET|nr:hypothetical protein [Rhizobium etli]APO74280.1 hypothetical protein AM571_CH01445 [Rhizobium etli 8C-3]
MRRRNPHGLFEWGRRRLLIYLTLLFCGVAATAILVVALQGTSTALLIALVGAIFSLAGATLGSYIFGAQWDTNNARNAGVTELTIGDDPPEGYAG